MLMNLIRWLIGYQYEWQEHHRIKYSNGTLFLFICKKTGKMKKVWLGE